MRTTQNEQTNPLYNLIIKGMKDVAVSAVLIASLTASLTKPAIAQLVPYNSASHSTKIIRNTYDWQHNPYSHVNHCLDYYYFYDNNNDGKMDQVSILFSLDGRAEEKFNRSDTYTRKSMNLADVTQHDFDGCFQGCIHRSHFSDCACSLCDKKYAQRLYRTLRKKCQENVRSRRVMSLSRAGKETGVTISGMTVDGKSVNSIEVLTLKDLYDQWDGLD